MMQSCFSGKNKNLDSYLADSVSILFNIIVNTFSHVEALPQNL